MQLGGEHESYVLEGIERFTKRLRPYVQLEWVLLSHAGGNETRSRRQESAVILTKIKERDLVIVLDEHGAQLDSPQFAKQLEKWQLAARPIVFIIGGAYGVSDALLARADTVWSLGPLVFPHQLVRLVLIEQLYRGFAILAGSPYHHA